MAHHLLHLVRPHRVLARLHHLLHVARTHRMLPGLHHLLMIRSHRLMIGHGFGECDARRRDDDYRTHGGELTCGKHWKPHPVDPGHCIGRTPPPCMIEIMRKAIFWAGLSSIVSRQPVNVSGGRQQKLLPRHQSRNGISGSPSSTMQTMSR